MLRKSFLVLGAALILTACGGSDDANKSENNPETTTEEIVGDMTGVVPTAELADDIEGIENGIVEDVEDAVDDTEEVSSADVDKMLDKYESVLNKYISLAKKVQKNDPSALAEYGTLAMELNELQDQIEKCKGNMTTAQANRFSKMLTKFSQQAAAAAGAGAGAAAGNMQDAVDALNGMDFNF